MTTPVERLLAKLPDAKPAGNGWEACCPSHEDRRASLSISNGDHGGAVLHCHAGCEPAAVVAALGLTLADLMPPNAKTKRRGAGRPKKAVASMLQPFQPKSVEASVEAKGRRGRIAAEYNYRDEGGGVVFQVVRYEPKDFRQRRPKPEGGWDWSVKGARVVPFQLPELLAQPNRLVAVAEGEKDVQGLARIGVLATCNAGGAGKKGFTWDIL